MTQCKVLVQEKHMQCTDVLPWVELPPSTDHSKAYITTVCVLLYAYVIRSPVHTIIIVLLYPHMVTVDKEEYRVYIINNTH